MSKTDELRLIEFSYEVSARIALSQGILEYVAHLCELYPPDDVMGKEFLRSDLPILMDNAKGNGEAILSSRQLQDLCRLSASETRLPDHMSKKLHPALEEIRSRVFAEWCRVQSK